MQFRKIKIWLSQPGFEPLTLDIQYSYKVRKRKKNWSGWESNPYPHVNKFSLALYQLSYEALDM